MPLHELVDKSGRAVIGSVVHEDHFVHVDRLLEDAPKRAFEVSAAIVSGYNHRHPRNVKRARRRSGRAFSGIAVRN
jgi:hypothetical protein